MTVDIRKIPKLDYPNKAITYKLNNAMPHSQPQRKKIRIEYQLLFGTSISIRQIFWNVFVLMRVVYNSFDHFRKKVSYPIEYFNFRCLMRFDQYS